MSASITIKGLQSVKRDLRRYGRLEMKAQAAALKKTMNSVRGAVRRFIQTEEGVTLKSTVRRVQWFWKSRKNAQAAAKMWVGTGIPITGNEVKALRGKKPADLKEIRPEMKRIIDTTAAKRLPIDLRSQFKRFGL